MGRAIWEGTPLLAPVPAVLVSSGTPDKPNVMTAAWTGIVCSKPPRTYVSIRPERFSHGIILQSREFVIGLAPAAIARTVDLCGVKSGRDTDKFSLAHLTAIPSSAVSAPQVAECPVSLECRVFEVLPLGSHDMFLADIVAVEVDERLIGADGKLRLEKAGLLAYEHGRYVRLGAGIGTFGFSVRKKPRRPPQGRKNSR